MIATYEHWSDAMLGEHGAAAVAAWEQRAAVVLKNAAEHACELADDGYRLHDATTQALMGFVLDVMGAGAARALDALVDAAASHVLARVEREVAR